MGKIELYWLCCANDFPMHNNDIPTFLLKSIASDIHC